MHVGQEQPPQPNAEVDIEEVATTVVSASLLITCTASGDASGVTGVLLERDTTVDQRSLPLIPLPVRIVDLADGSDSPHDNITTLGLLRPSLQRETRLIFGQREKEFSWPRVTTTWSTWQAKSSALRRALILHRSYELWDWRQYLPLRSLPASTTSSATNRTVGSNKGGLTSRRSTPCHWNNLLATWMH